MEGKFIEILSNGVNHIVIWEFHDGRYMSFEDTDYRLQINNKTRYKLEGYKKIENRVVDKEKILNLYKAFYFQKGHFISGSITFGDLKWRFPDVSDGDLRKMLYDLVKDDKLLYTNTIGGASYCLTGDIRIELIEKNNLITKWKEIVNGRALWMHNFEKEYECAKKNIRCHND